MLKQAMILAAGYGKRMLPLTKYKPKPLLCVNNKPLILWQIEKLGAAGIYDIVINVYHLGTQIQDFLGDGKRFGVNIKYSVEPELLGTGGGIIYALQQNLLTADKFLVISSDIYTEFNYNSLVSPLLNKSQVYCILTPNPIVRPSGDFGINNSNQQLNLEHKYNYGNIGVFSKKLFDTTCNPLDYPGLGNVIRSAVKTGNAYGEIYNGLWDNIGTVVDLVHANAFISDKSEMAIES